MILHKLGTTFTSSAIFTIPENCLKDIGRKRSHPYNTKFDRYSLTKDEIRRWMRHVQPAEWFVNYQRRSIYKNDRFLDRHLWGKIPRYYAKLKDRYIDRAYLNPSWYTYWTRKFEKYDNGCGKKSLYEYLRGLRLRNYLSNGTIQYPECSIFK